MLRTIVGFIAGGLLMGMVALLTGWTAGDTVDWQPAGAELRASDGRLDRSHLKLADALDVAGMAIADLNARSSTLERLARNLSSHSFNMHQWANHLRSRSAGDCPTQLTIATIRRILFRARVAVDETNPEHPPFAGSTLAGPASTMPTPSSSSLIPARPWPVGIAENGARPMS